MKLTLLALSLLSLFTLAFAATQSANEKEAVRQAVLDYVEGVYHVDPSRIERSVHPELTKHGFWKAKDKLGYATGKMSYAELPNCPTAELPNCPTAELPNCPTE